ncbi:MAG: hypothetical protein AVDCRST_MAG71-1360, partial [uncultured Lysobacter sp.]
CAGRGPRTAGGQFIAACGRANPMAASSVRRRRLRSPGGPSGASSFRP